MQRSATLTTLLALVLLTQTACVVIEDGEVGVSKSFGSIDDSVSSDVAHQSRR